MLVLFQLGSGKKFDKQRTDVDEEITRLDKIRKDAEQRLLEDFTRKVNAEQLRFEKTLMEEETKKMEELKEIERHRADEVRDLAEKRIELVKELERQRNENLKELERKRQDDKKEFDKERKIMELQRKKVDEDLLSKFGAEIAICAEERKKTADEIEKISKEKKKLASLR